MIWPWQYKSKMAEAKARIAELKLAGWELTCLSYELSGSSDLGRETALKEFNWHRECAVFAKDAPIDGERPNYTDYHAKAKQH